MSETETVKELRRVMRSLSRAEKSVADLKTRRNDLTVRAWKEGERVVDLAKIIHLKRESIYKMFELHKERSR